MCKAFSMSPTAKKLALDPDPVARAFADAEEGLPLSDEDRAALLEATSQPKSQLDKPSA